MWSNGSRSVIDLPILAKRHSIPDLQVNNAPTSIWPHTFHKRLIISGIFFIISHREDLEFFQVLNLKRKSNKHSRKEWTWTEDHSLKNLRSIHLGYLRADDCRWKKVDTRNHFGLDSHGLPVLALQRSPHRDTTLSSRTFRVERQISGERTNLPGIRLLLPSASKIPAWLFSSPYWPRLRLGQYVGSENNRRYFLGLEI